MPKFKVGDNVVCINNDLGYEYLILNKTYKIIDILDDEILINDYFDEECWYNIKFFISLQELRKQKILSIFENV